MSTSMVQRNRSLFYLRRCSMPTLQPEVLRCHRSSLLATKHRRLVLSRYHRLSVLMKYHYLLLRLLHRHTLDRRIGHSAPLTSGPPTRSPFSLCLHRLRLCQPNRSIRLIRCKFMIQLFLALTFQGRFHASYQPVRKFLLNHLLRTVSVLKPNRRRQFRSVGRDQKGSLQHAQNVFLSNRFRLKLAQG